MIIDSKIRAIEEELRMYYPELHREVMAMIEHSQLTQAIYLLEKKLEINIWTSAKLVEYLSDDELAIDDRTITADWISIPKCSGCGRSIPLELNRSSRKLVCSDCHTKRINGENFVILETQDIEYPESLCEYDPNAEYEAETYEKQCV